ncbi:hypothetical protein [Dermatobacter hominis]|uniref:hypothetical protein n=1 Tax=Dermatobacter hominis TaxID=2884263 RepID=UPI001D117385|nr:hypothetical protein [Dermatobacter hominis]UDY37843.1 hypothetical protein LH044_09935 [Dermatobacter hominis]
MRVGAAIVVERSTRLAAPPGPVWRHAASMAGVNQELGPFVRMTHPSHLGDLTEVLAGDDAAALLGAVAFRSWLLGFGVVPFDRHALRLVAVTDGGVAGGSFREDSTSWLQRRWRHDRDVVADGTGSRVTDRVVVEPRVGVARPVTAAVVGFLFSHRHRRLASRFGAAPGPVQSPSDAPSDRGASSQRGSTP